MTELPPIVPPGHDIFPIVGIGASAGGLEALSQFLIAQPADTGMAFILVQHLDPTHESMMVELLAKQTLMTVCDAVDLMQIERDRVYIIPPNAYLEIKDGLIRLREPADRTGVRLPFDCLLHSMATELGENAICVVLSGMGSDGSNGLQAFTDAGLVIAQDPEEATFNEMPLSAIATGAVDLVLPVNKIPAAILEFIHRHNQHRHNPLPPDLVKEWLPEIIALLRSRLALDFSPYKHGTLQRRIERRRAIASVDGADMKRYIEILRNDPAELRRLADDMLINVTSFFRDPESFDLLERKLIPEIISRHPDDLPIRIWSVGCSSGEEIYSIAILFQEAIAAARRNIKLQIFASDMDANAIAEAREGIYPEAVAAEISPERLAQFFLKEEAGYKISPELRQSVVFTTHDALNEPPFSNLEFICCRNMLIYLKPAAQAKMTAMFDFALRPGGLLFLGSAEALAAEDDRFELVSKPARIYRHLSGAKPSEAEYALANRTGTQPGFPNSPVRPNFSQRAFANLSKNILLDLFAPASVLINKQREIIYSHGDTHHYLRIAPGAPSLDILSMTQNVSAQIQLRKAIETAQQAGPSKPASTAKVSPLNSEDKPFLISVRALEKDGEHLLLVTFSDEAESWPRLQAPVAPKDISRFEALEIDLVAAQSDLKTALENLEITSAQHRTFNQETLSINEEFQSTNEELLTSKEELHSLNEELVALNNQLQATLELQRRTSDDLKNVLFSTDIATFFLDELLNLRFYTPAAKSIFNVIATDIGRPLADLRSRAEDDELLSAASDVLVTLKPAEREITSESGDWFLRRIVPYRTNKEEVGGIVITYTNINERRSAELGLAEARQQAEQANLAQSNFLAAASHDLRQPLQTIALIQGLLVQGVRTEAERTLLAQLDQTLAAMSAMLNTLLDINQLDTGAIKVRMTVFPINALLERLRSEFSYLAEGQGLELRILSCIETVRTDPHLLEQMIRNLISNAMKYTQNGRVLIGCRRRGDGLRIEVWDTGVGIPESEHQAIFDAYHQVDRNLPGKAVGLGLGLSIVARLGALLDHPIEVRSRRGKGSMFAIEIREPGESVASAEHTEAPAGISASIPQDNAESLETSNINNGRTGSILVVDDDPSICVLLKQILTNQGHIVEVARKAATAMAAIASGAFQPDIILVDFNLPNDVDGLTLAAELREMLQRNTPVILLTGDISTDTLHEISGYDCLHMSKPLRAEDLTLLIQRLLAASHKQSAEARPDPQMHSSNRVMIIDDDKDVRTALQHVLEDVGYSVISYAAGEPLLEVWQPSDGGCLLIDANLPGISGVQLLQRLQQTGHTPPAIMITAYGDVNTAVSAMKAGALDFIEKPFSRDDILAGIKRALNISRESANLADWQAEAKSKLEFLTPRQRQILALILAGEPNKNIAADLGISQRTVENHRAGIMKRTGATSLPALVRLAVAASSDGLGPLIEADT